MSVYVDNAYLPFRNLKMCHLVADTSEELRAFAIRIGCRPEWIQQVGTPHEHLDVSVRKRMHAVTAGAVEITIGEMGLLLAKRRLAWKQIS